MPSPVSVVVACYPGDADQALRLFRWIAELGRVRAPLLLIASEDCPLNDLQYAANMAFDSVKLELDTDKVISDWSAKEAGPKSAAGPNSLWKRAAWYFYMVDKKNWFWLEPDSVPLTRDWFDVLLAEYQNMDKPFMGALIENQMRTEAHMSGTGFYHHRTPEFMTEAMRAEAVAFDAVDAKKVLAQAHITTRIHDQYRAPGFTSMAEVTARVGPDKVLWHSNKDGSLIPFMRQKLGIMDSRDIQDVIQIVQEHAIDSKVKMVELARNTPVVDIVIKSYPADYPMLNIALESIAKYARMYRRIILLVPPEWSGITLPEELRGRVTYRTVNEQSPGYLWQQRCKLYADEHTDAQYLWFHDSDCVLTRPVDVSELFIAGRPYWLKTPFDQARQDQSVWKPVMEEFTGRTAHWELMRRHNFLVDRTWLSKLREFCRYRHGKELSDHIMGKAVPGTELALTFSEWNCLGHFLHEFQSDLVSWVDTTKDKVPEAYVFQAWSHCEGVEMEQQLEKMKFAAGLTYPIELKRTDEPLSAIMPTAAAEPAEPAKPTVSSAIAFLVEQAQKDGFAKGRILKRLKEAGLVKGGKLKAQPGVQEVTVKEVLERQAEITRNVNISRHISRQIESKLLPKDRVA
jgi:hypothetical protein